MDDSKEEWINSEEAIFEHKRTYWLKRKPARC